MRGLVSALVLLAQLFIGTTTLAQTFDHDHRDWTALLKQHVVLLDGGKASRVRYGGFQKDRPRLKAYLEALSRVSEQEFGSWSRERRLAFLLNAYNAATIEKVLTRYPDIRSIWDFGKVFGNPFRDRFVRLLGREMSLDAIEHDTIRAEGAYNDPRIHFALNCAAAGCPMLREEAYLAGRLERQLEEQTARFLSDRARNRYNAESGALEISKIFDAAPWYGDDFRRGWKGYGSLEQFLANYADLLADTPAHRQAIGARQAKLRFLDYDWSLNDARQ